MEKGWLFEISFANCASKVFDEAPSWKMSNSSFEDEEHPTSKY
jgi:hypothetical protein